jgi:hypothetical protein
VLVVVAPEAAGPVFVPDVFRICPPVGLHFREKILAAQIVFRLRMRFVTARPGWMTKSKSYNRVLLSQLAD